MAVQLAETNQFVAGLNQEQRAYQRDRTRREYARNEQPLMVKAVGVSALKVAGCVAVGAGVGALMGAGVGAFVGSHAGPLAPVTIPAFAVKGAGVGAAAGAAAGFLVGIHFAAATWEVEVKPSDHYRRWRDEKNTDTTLAIFQKFINDNPALKRHIGNHVTQQNLDTLPGSSWEEKWQGIVWKRGGPHYDPVVARNVREAINRVFRDHVLAKAPMYEQNIIRAGLTAIERDLEDMTAQIRTAAFDRGRDGVARRPNIYNRDGRAEALAHRIDRETRLPTSAALEMSETVPLMVDAGTAIEEGWLGTPIEQEEQI